MDLGGYKSGGVEEETGGSAREGGTYFGPGGKGEGEGWPEGERGGEGGGNYWKSTMVAAALVEMVVRRRWRWLPVVLEI